MSKAVRKHRRSIVIESSAIASGLVLASVIGWRIAGLGQGVGLPAGVAATLNSWRVLGHYVLVTISFALLAYLAVTSIAGRPKPWYTWATGACLLFTAMGLGALRAIEVDVPGWYADLRVIAALVILILSLCLLFTRVRAAKWAAFLAALLLAALALEVLLVSTLLTGFHLFAW